ncbi:unnamed protein product [Nippostrongylus brasiliensis]|uniref:Uncharacterized protein n=1 Tax=Nippostrongylus brasiliensis TaxID=27835 RepID=A0A0N4Y2N8_NIPBR|nr:unnamed protein product [Nippostrongylus brasiliensis]
MLTNSVALTSTGPLCVWTIQSFINIKTNKSMIPRLLPIPLVRQRGAAVEVENYDDETNRPEGLAHL